MLPELFYSDSSYGLLWSFLFSLVFITGISKLFAKELQRKILIVVQGIELMTNKMEVQDSTS